LGLTKAIVRGLKSYPLPARDYESYLLQGGGSVRLTGSVSSSYATLYQTQIWVYVCVNKLARGIARLPLKVYRRDGLERERSTSGALLDLMLQPYPGGSPFAFKEAVIGNLCLYGNAIAVKVRASPARPPEELWPVAWPNWEIVRGITNPIDWYVWHGPDGKDFPFRPEEVVHWKWWAPGSRGDILGLSPLEPLRRTLVAEDASQRLVAASFENGARPTGAMTSEAQYDLTKPGHKAAYDRLREDLEQAYGGVDKAFRIMLLHGGLKWESFSHTFEEARVIEFRKLAREEVLAAYDIPPPIVGVLDHATFSNIDEQHLMLYMDTMGPPCTMVEETLQVQLLNGEPAFAGQFLEFDFKEVLKGDSLKEQTALRMATYMTPNEKRARMNLAPIEDPRADSIFVPLNEYPIGDDAEVMAELMAPPAPARNGNGRG
jgi:HK97 family phage portal protein